MGALAGAVLYTTGSGGGGIDIILRVKNVTLYYIYSQLFELDSRIFESEQPR